MRVPVLEGDRVESRPVATPSAQTNQKVISAGEGLAELGAGAANLGTAIADKYKEIQTKAHAISQAEADAAYQQAETKLLVGGSNREQLVDNAFNETGPSSPDNLQQQPGFLSTRGKEAFAQSASVLEQMQKAREKIAEDGFSDEEQRKQWLARSAGFYADTDRKVQQHSAQQFGVAAEDALKGKLSSTLEAIASDADGSQTGHLMASAEQSIRALQESKEGGDAAIQKLQQEALKTRIGRLLTDGNIAVAEKQFEVAKDRLGTAVPEVERAIDHAKKTQTQAQKDIEGEKAAQLIFNQAVDPKSGWVDPVKASAEVDKLPAGPVKDEARQRLEHRLQVAHQQKEQAVVQHFDSALAAYQQGGTLAAIAPSDKVWLQDKNNDPTAWERLRSIARADAEHAKGAPPTPDQQRAMTQFLVDLNDHRDKYATMPEAQFNSTVVPSLAKSDRERAGAAFAAAHGQAAKPGALTSDETKMLLETGRSAGLFPDKINDVSKWDDDQAELYYQATKTLTDWATTYRQQNGKPAPFEEVQKQARELVLAGKNPDKTWFGMIGGGTTRLEAETRHTPFVPTFGDDEKTAAAAALKRAGARVDDATIETYLRRKHKLPAAPTQAAPPPEPSPVTPDIPDALTPGQD